MNKMSQRLLIGTMTVVSLGTTLLAQRRVDLRNTHERLLCVVPIVGAGTYEDPRRPAYAPQAASPQQVAARGGIIAFAYEISEDGQFALVEYVATTRAAFKQILADRNVKAFQKGKARRADIEREFRKYKRDLNLDQWGVSLP